MEKLRSHEIFVPLFPLLLFLLQFSSPQLLSSVYTPPDKYFVNCGSEANVTFFGRNFVADMNSGLFSFSGKESIPVKDSSLSSDTTSPIYQTARVFPYQSSYDFEISNNGTYLVRLHFYAFSSSTDLSKARFNVSASGTSLMQNFTAQSSSNSPVIKEFLLSINVSRFVIYFMPCQESSLAFVNAIEVFLAPQDFIPDDAPHVTPAGRNNIYKGMLSQVLHPIYRINVGGPLLTAENDTLWRNWLPNNSYIFDPNTAKNSPVHKDKLNYLEGEASEYTAPDFVYRTALEMNIDNESNFFNITWCFNVSKSAKHFVRVHFCDIVSLSPSMTVFNLYIFSNFIQEIDPQNKTDLLDAPFYKDFVVDSDGSGLLNISIGPRNDCVSKTAFLNGLEIMEMIGELVLVTTTNEPEKKHGFILLGSVIGGLVLICILIAVFLLGLKRRKLKPVEMLDWSPLVLYGGSSHSRETEGTVNGSPIPNLNLGLKVSLAEILFATNNFDMKLLIGQGGFGKVYRGTLRNGLKVAVKRSEPGLGQGRPEFQTEILVLSKIRYRHLVSLIAYCDEGDEMVLVYEFMEKGTLRHHLYESNLPRLSWKQRLEICIGSARGLHYLHTGSARGIIHRDVKSSNILLDENFVAKVADFGLSRSVPLDQTYVSTCVKGSIGYLDPEYMRSQQLTEKSDVYSFGVVLLEVLCGRAAIDPLLPREQMNLAEWGMHWQKKAQLEQIIDPLLRGDINPNSLRKFGETAEKCLQEQSEARPTMGDVLWDLEYALQLQQSAAPREPHEDSAIDSPSMFRVPNVQRFPSISFSIETDGVPTSIDTNSSNTIRSEVFSLLVAGDGR